MNSTISSRLVVTTVTMVILTGSYCLSQTSPEDVARLTNCEVAVPRSELIDLPEGSHYIFELVGCELIEEGTEKSLGKIVAVEQYPANDAYVVKTPDGQQVLFPAVRQFVKEIDTEAGRIVVDPAGWTDNEKSQTTADEV